MLNKKLSKISKKEKGDSKILVEVLLILIGVGIALIFREQLGDLVSILMSAISETVSSWIG